MKQPDAATAKQTDDSKAKPVEKKGGLDRFLEKHAVSKVAFGIFCAIEAVLVVFAVIGITKMMPSGSTGGGSYEVVDVKGKTVKEACEIIKKNGWENVYITVWSSSNDYRQGDCYSELEVQDYDYDGGYCWGVSASSKTKKNVCITAYDNGYKGSSSSAEEKDEDEEKDSSSETTTESAPVETTPVQTTPSTPTSSTPSSSSSSSASGYQAIYDTYAARLRNECPSLSISECAEIETEGVGKMAEYMWTAKGTDGQYATYEEWAGKLWDVYMESAR